MNYYEILEVYPTASLEIIEAAFEVLSKRYSPETSSLDIDEALEKSALVSEAYEVLSDSERRKEYDEKLGVISISLGTNPPPPPPPMGLVEELRALGLEYLDKRPSKGALWVIGTKELEESITKLGEKYNVKFNFSEKGGRATKHRSAWWTADEG